MREQVVNEFCRCQNVTTIRSNSHEHPGPYFLDEEIEARSEQLNKASGLSSKPLFTPHRGLDKHPTGAGEEASREVLAF